METGRETQEGVVGCSFASDGKGPPCSLLRVQLSCPTHLFSTLLEREEKVPDSPTHLWEHSVCSRWQQPHQLPEGHDFVHG